MITVRIRRLLLGYALPAFVLVLLYTVLGFVLVPHLIRSGVHDFVTKNYHHDVALGDVRFNPFTLRLDVRDFSLPDADGQPMLAFRHLVVDLTVASIWRWGPDFESILLEQPFARVLIKPDGRLNLSDLALPPSPGAKTEPKSEPSRLFINHFSVQGGNVAFEDLAHPSAFRTEIKPITFDLRNFSTVSKDGGTYVLNGASEAGERFTWSGALSATPLASHGQFSIENLQAKTIWSYVRDSVRFELPTGAISIAGDYDFTTATTPTGLAVNVHQVTVSDLGIRPQGAADDYIKIVQLEVHDTRADVAKHTVDVGSVRLAGGEIRTWLPGAGGTAVNLLELVGASATAAGKPVPEAAAPAKEPASEPPATAGQPAPSASPTPSAPAAPPGAPTTGPDAPAPEAPTWVVSVPDIAVDNLNISAEDRKVSPTVAMHLTDLGLHVNGFSTSRNTPVAVTLTTKINRDGKLDAKADLSPDLAAVKVQAELASFDLTVFQPYIAQRTAMTLRNGSLSTKLNAERAADGHLTVAGEVDITKLRTIDNELKRDFIKFDRLQVAGIDYQANLSDSSKPASLHIRNVVARGPYARVIIEADQTTNVSRVLRSKGEPPPPATPATPGAPGPAASAPTPTATAATPTPAQAVETVSSAPTGPAHSRVVAATERTHSKRHGSSKPTPATTTPANDGSMAIAIDAIDIQDGSANYADLWIQPHFGIGIQALNGSILGLSSNPRSHAKVDLAGKVDRYAPIRIWGDTNPLAATAYTDIKMSFKSVELSSVTPYSGRFAGYKIEKGKLSADIDYKIKDRQLTADHRFVIDQLELGERVESPDAVKLPLKIAVALLKDRNGVIDIPLPITGSLDDPQFKIGPIIWKAVLNLLTKVATAPFALIGHLFGGGEQMSHIDFAPGSAVLEQSERDKLTTLVKALKEKDKLELDVPITYSPDLDRPGLAMAHLNARLLEIKQDPSGRSKRGKGNARTAAAPATTAAAGTQPAANMTAERLAPTPNVAAETESNRPSAIMDSPPPNDPALTDPAQRFRLLVDLYRAELGKSAPLPDSVKAAEAASKKKDPPPDFAAANAELEAALLQKMPTPDNELERLGKHRARAIQDVLLIGTDLDPSRVFVIGTAPKGSQEKDKVRVELALK